MSDLRTLTERAHRAYQDTKRSMVLKQRQRVDLSGSLDVYGPTEDNPVIIVVDRPQLATVCESLAGEEVAAVVYSSDAVRRAFDELADVERFRPGDNLKAFEQGDPEVQECLATLGVSADGELAAIVSGYGYRNGAPVFGAMEFDSLLDSSVVNDLRRIFR